MSTDRLRLFGQVANEVRLSFEDLCRMDAAHQIEDVSQLSDRRQGQAVKLSGLLQQIELNAKVDFITFHCTEENFHASVPLHLVADTALLIYRLEDDWLPASQGGPMRIWIPESVACQTGEIDDCANVKHVDAIEFNIGRGADTR